MEEESHFHQGPVTVVRAVMNPPPNLTPWSELHWLHGCSGMCAPLRALCREGASAQFKAPLSLLKFWIHFEQGTLPFHFELGPPVL